MRNVPLDMYRFGVELVGAEGVAAHGVGTDGALLVRPDGFVAWRAEAAAEDSERTLEHVLSRLLCRATGQARQRLKDTIDRRFMTRFQRLAGQLPSSG